MAHLKGYHRVLMVSRTIAQSPDLLQEWLDEQGDRGRELVTLIPNPNPDVSYIAVFRVVYDIRERIHPGYLQPPTTAGNGAGDP